MKITRCKRRGSITALLPFGWAFFVRRYCEGWVFEFRTRKTVREWTFRYETFPVVNIFDDKEDE